MRIAPPLRWTLVVVALALAIAGLAGPVTRALHERERAAQARASQDKAQAERDAAVASFNANRATILADLRAKIDASDYVEALRIAAPYGAVPDEELRALFREAATAESQRQRGEAYARLVERDCNEAHAAAQAVKVFESLAAGVAKPALPASLVRLAPAPARQAVLARMREPAGAHFHALPAPGSPPPKTDWIADMRAASRVRLLPDFVGFVYSPIVDRILCVWDIEGERRVDGATMRYRMTLWLAPTPDVKGLTGDVAAYSEVPR